MIAPTLRTSSHPLPAVAVALAIACAFVGAASRTAQAQPAYDEFALERFHPSLDRDGVLDVDSGRIGEGFSASAWMTAVDNPLVLTRLSDGSEVGALVAKRYALELTGTVSLWHRVRLGLSVPVVLYQSSTVPAAEMPVGSQPLPGGGLGDIRFVPKVRILDRRLQVSLLLALTLPPGSPGGFLRESGPTAAPHLAASTNVGAANVAANVGYRFRNAVEIANRVADDEAFARAGISVPLRRTTELALSLAAVVPAEKPYSGSLAVHLGGSRSVGPWRMLVAGGVGVGTRIGNPDWRLIAAVEWSNQRSDVDHDGVPDRLDRCPAQAEDVDRYEDADGCVDLDDDGDGVPDTSDKAPRIAEDRDGFEDGDGAPDPDNDKDNILDTADRCPLQAETANGKSDDDGCPDELAIALAIEVKNPRGIPVRRAKIKLTSPTGVTEHETDAAGMVGPIALDAPGPVSFVVSARGFKDKTEQATVERGLEPTRVGVTLPQLPHGTIRGFIRGFDGKGIAAKIRVEPDAIDIVADQDGIFELDLPPGSHQILVDATGFAGQKRAVRVNLGGVTLLNVDLRKSP